MPTYEYACSTCDATHEVQQKMTDPTLTECPVCGKATVRKLFSGVGVHFKGSGFYRTDSRSGSDTSTSSSKSSDSSSAGKSSDNSSAGKSSDNSSAGTSTTKTASTTS